MNSRSDLHQRESEALVAVFPNMGIGILAQEEKKLSLLGFGTKCPPDRQHVELTTIPPK
jgi:hypothetical protein